MFSAGAASNLLGGTVAGAANVVSGNYYRGVFFDGAGTSGNLVQGNFIGTDRTGTNDLGNYDNVEFQNNATGNIVGGITAGAGNVIAFATGTGVAFYDPGTTNNSVRGNSISGSFYLGLDLNGDGVTLNHAGFLAGPNNLQNFPVITDAFSSGGRTVVSGNLNSDASKNFWVDVYRNVAPNDSGYGEGQFYFGTVSVMTDGFGTASFSLTNNSGNFAGQYFTATATSAGGDTSEFSAAVQAVNQMVPSATFIGPYQFRSTGFAFTLTLQTNFAYRIQTATNLATTPVVWVDLTNFTANSSLLNFTDRTATNFPRRFYRVISP